MKKNNPETMDFVRTSSKKMGHVFIQRLQTFFNLKNAFNVCKKIF